MLLMADSRPALAADAAFWRKYSCRASCHCRFAALALASPSALTSASNVSPMINALPDCRTSFMKVAQGDRATDEQSPPAGIRVPRGVRDVGIGKRAFVEVARLERLRADP